MMFLCRSLFPIALTVAISLHGAVERYKVEADYIARLQELGHVVLTEDFEGSAWEAVRSDYPTQNWAVSVASQGLDWSSAADDLWTYPGGTGLITTNGNWARGPGWGVYDNYLASSLRIIAPEVIYGIGFWVNTNPDLEDVGILFDDRDFANEPGYVMPGYGAMYPGDIHPTGHAFVGFIDPDGFTEVIVTGTLEINEENQLEGGTVFGADDFTFAVPPGFILNVWQRRYFSPADLADPLKEATVWGPGADPDHDGKSNWDEYIFAGNPNEPDAMTMAVLVEILDEEGGPWLQFSYNQRRNDPGLSYTPQVSDDFTTWFNDPAHVLQTAAVRYLNEFEQIICRHLTPLGGGNPAFSRIEVTDP